MHITCPWIEDFPASHVADGWRVPWIFQACVPLISPWNPIKQSTSHQDHPQPEGMRQYSITILIPILHPMNSPIRVPLNLRETLVVFGCRLWKVGLFRAACLLCDRVVEFELASWASQMATGNPRISRPKWTHFQTGWWFGCHFLMFPIYWE